jgi:hypothetical protein
LNGQTIGSHGLVTIRSFCPYDLRKNSQDSQPKIAMAGKKRTR